MDCRRCHIVVVVDVAVFWIAIHQTLQTETKNGLVDYHRPGSTMRPLFAEVAAVKKVFLPLTDLTRRFIRLLFREPVRSSGSTTTTTNDLLL
jgi:hypothetical protein